MFFLFLAEKSALHLIGSCKKWVIRIIACKLFISNTFAFPSVRFGFIKATDTGHLSSVSYQNLKKDHIQYIHMTGMVLVLIYPPTNQHSAFGDTFSSPNQSPANDDITQSNESQEWTSNLVAEAGYNWVPNYLLTKRWRTSSCGDEKFPERLLLDFSRFCANHEDRLKEFWKRSKEACLQKETQWPFQVKCQDVHVKNYSTVYVICTQEHQYMFVAHQCENKEQVK